MALDSVELVMAIEAEFGIDIPHEDCEKMFTVGDIYEWLKARIASSDPVAFLTQRVFYKLRWALLENHELEGAPSDRIPDSLIMINGRALAPQRESEEEIWHRVVRVFVREVNVSPEQIRPEASITRDLGVD